MIALLFSGGIDSYCCLSWAVKEFGVAQVQPIYYNYGQSYLDREYMACVTLLNCVPVVRKLAIHSLDLHEDGDGHVPLRNLSMIIDVARRGYTGVVFGMLQGEAPEDKNPKFVKRVQELLDSQFVANEYRFARIPFKIYTPFATKTKAQMIRWFLDKYSPDALYNTVACLTKEGNCGRCMSCFNRWVAWETNWMEDETFDWLEHPGKAMVERLRKMRKQPNQYNWVFLKNAWVRRKWLYEAYRVMNRYTLNNYGKSFLKAILA